MGKVIDFFFVTEFQARGNEHDHAVIWIKKRSKISNKF